MSTVKLNKFRLFFDGNEVSDAKSINLNKSNNATKRKRFATEFYHNSCLTFKKWVEKGGEEYHIERLKTLSNRLAIVAEFSLQFLN